MLEVGKEVPSFEIYFKNWIRKRKISEKIIGTPRKTPGHPLISNGSCLTAGVAYIVKVLVSFSFQFPVVFLSVRGFLGKKLHWSLARLSDGGCQFLERSQLANTESIKQTHSPQSCSQVIPTLVIMPPMFSIVS